MLHKKIVASSHAQGGSTRVPFSKTFEAIQNARDLSETSSGILPGTIYRSGNPSDATKEDSIKLRKDFNIRNFLDLRSGEEHAMDTGWHTVLSNGVIKTYNFSKSQGVHWDTDHIPPGDLDLPPCEMHRISLLEKKRFVRKLLWRLPLAKTIVALGFKMIGMENRSKEILLPVVNALGLPLVYEIILETAKEEIKRCMFTILEAQRRKEPVLMFCRLGKDRTGLMSALVLACCDIPRSDILDDYTKSNDLDEVALGGIEKMDSVQGVDTRLFSSAPREALEQTLDYINEKYGNVHDYLDEIGFSYHFQMELKQLITRHVI
jgi:protein tyrosine/serine phosphatase